MAVPPITVTLTADTQALTAALQSGFGQMSAQIQALQAQFANLAQQTQQNTNAITANTQTMSTGFSNLGSAGAGLGRAFAGLPQLFMAVAAGLVAIAAGGKFKDYIEDWVSGGVEAGMLASKLRITVSEADQLNDALELGGNSSKDYLSSFAMLNKQLTANSDELARMGFAIDMVNAKDVTRNQLLQEGYRVMMQYAEGPDRDAAAMKTFGKSADEVSGMMVRLNQNMEAAVRINKAFGEASAEEAEAAKGYRQSMAELGLIMGKLGEVIGGQLFPAARDFANLLIQASETAIPAFISMVQGVYDVVAIVANGLIDIGVFAFELFGSTMSDTAKEGAITWQDFMNALGTTIAAIKVVVIGLMAAFASVFEGIKLIVRTAATYIAAMMDVIDKAMHFDLVGAAKAYSAWAASVKKDATETAQVIMEKMKQAQDAQKRVAAGGEAAASPIKPPAPIVVPPPAAGGNRKFDRSKVGGGGSADDAAKAELALAKAISDGRLQIAQQGLKNEEAEVKRSLDRREITETQYLESVKSLRDQNFALLIKSKQEELAQLDIQEKKTTKLSARIGIQAQEIKVQNEIKKIEMERAEAVRDIAEQSRKAADATSSQLGTMRSEIAQLSGMNTLGAKLDEIQRKFADLPKSIAQSAEAAQLKALQVVQAQIDETKKQFANMQGNDDLRAVGAKDLYNRGLMTEANLKKEIANITRQNADAEISSLNEQIRLLDQLGVGYDAQKAKLLEQRDALSRLKEGIDETAVQINASMTSGIEGALNNVLTGKGLKGFATSFSNMITGEISKKMANGIMGSLNSSGLGGSGGFLGKLLGTGGKDNNNDAMAAAAQAATASLTSMTQDGVMKTTEGLITQVTQQSATQSISGMLNSAFEMLSNAAQQAASALSSIGSSGGGAGGGGAAGGIMSLFGEGGFLGGFLANGGYAMGGTPYVVGENGPELFVPSTSGSVVPNDKFMGGGGSTVYMSINTPNADSFRRANNQVITDYGRAMTRANARNG